MRLVRGAEAAPGRTDDARMSGLSAYGGPTALVRRGLEIFGLSISAARLGVSSDRRARALIPLPTSARRVENLISGCWRCNGTEKSMTRRPGDPGSPRRLLVESRPWLGGLLRGAARPTAE